jgi:hypothetical protein
LTGTRVYKTWESMKARCYNPNDAKYKNYGARGIIVCEEWRNNAGAFAKWAYANGFDESKRQTKQSLDRINVDGNYCPENCRFVDAKTQANNKTDNFLIEFNGETDTLANWSKRTGIKQGTIAWRISQGWSVEKALTQKAVNRKRIGKRYIEYKGEIKTMAEWAKEIQMPYKILCSRMNRGWSIERALETPIGDDKWHKKK